MNAYCKTLLENVAVIDGTKLARVGREALDERLRQLPMAQPSRALEQLGGLLEGIIASDWSTTDRWRALQALAVPLATLRGGLRKSIRGLSHPMAPAKVGGAVQLGALEQRLGEAFALLACALCGRRGKAPLLGRRRLVAVLNAALTHQSLALMLAWEIGRTPPPRLWPCVHAGAGLAIDLGLARHPRRVDGETVARGVRDRYAAILLLAAADPYAWSHGELLRVAPLARVLAPHAELRAAERDGPASGAPRGERGPRRATAEGVVAVTDALLLDTAPVLTTLQDRVAAGRDLGDDRIVVQSSCGRAEAPIDLATRLLALWRGSAERLHERLPANHVLDAALGFTALHRVLAAADFDSFVEHVAGTQIEVTAGASAAAWVTGPSADQRGRFTARVLDQSPGGYRLRWPPSPGLRLREGSLLGLSPAADAAGAQSWMPAMLRWLRQDDGGDVTAGVSLLATEVCAAAVRCVDGNGRLRHFERALLTHDGHGADVLIVAAITGARPDAVELSCAADSGGGRTAERRVRRGVARSDALGSEYLRITLAPVAAA